MQTAKLFPNGQSQAVRLPKEYRFDGDRVYIQRMGEAVVLLPYARGWQVLFDSLAQFSTGFAEDAAPASVQSARPHAASHTPPAGPDAS